VQVGKVPQHIANTIGLVIVQSWRQMFFMQLKIFKHPCKPRTNAQAVIFT
jgi:hypothetical protein